MQGNRASAPLPSETSITPTNTIVAPVQTEMASCHWEKTLAVNDDMKSQTEGTLKWCQQLKEQVLTDEVTFSLVLEIWAQIEAKRKKGWYEEARNANGAAQCCFATIPASRNASETGADDSGAYYPNYGPQQPAPPQSGISSFLWNAWVPGLCSTAVPSVSRRVSACILTLRSGTAKGPIRRCKLNKHLTHLLLLMHNNNHPLTNGSVQVPQQAQTHPQQALLRTRSSSCSAIISTGTETTAPAQQEIAEQPLISFD
ncbi:hypothetical protein OSTOST_19384 [Ostertagia ostertagi]